MPSSRSTGRESAARIDGTLVPARFRASARAAVVASRPIAVATASAATQRLTPRQPILEPTHAAIGTPTSSVSDWPLMTQPSARPCWSAETRPETSVKITPVNMPQHPPASVAQAATARKVPAVATPIDASASASGPPIRNGRRPHRSDPAPANIDVIPHEIEVTATRLATSGTLTRRSRAMSIRNGARVVPLAAAVNMASDAAASNAQGIRPDRENRAGIRSGALIGRSVAMHCDYSSGSGLCSSSVRCTVGEPGGALLVSAHGQDQNWLWRRTVR